jgi:hypothetical protein
MAAASIPASAGPGAGAEADGDPRSQETAAHSLPDGVDVDDVAMVAAPGVGVGCGTMAPGARQPKPRAERAMSQRHFHTTPQG